MFRREIWLMDIISNEYVQDAEVVFWILDRWRRERMVIKRENLSIDENVKEKVKAFLINTTQKDKIDEIVTYSIDKGEKIITNQDEIWRFYIKVDLKESYSSLNYKYKKNVYDQLMKISDSDYTSSFKENADEVSFILEINLNEEIYYGEYDMNSDIQELYRLIYSDTKDCSGDIVFNFNSKKRKYFNTIIDNDKDASEDIKSYVKKLIEKCGNFHHSPENCVLMQSSGNLNGIKQVVGNDRMDTFASVIDLYFKGFKSIILNSSCCTAKNMDNLNNYLSGFENSENEPILKFFKEIYKISDEDFIHNIISMGKEPINSTKMVFKYILLSYKYWENKQSFYVNSSEDVREKYFKCVKNNLQLEFFVGEEGFNNDYIDNILDEEDDWLRV